jgi:Na+-transporting methylmalonyl-CoA/oxaloacetate decarboxylase gamma subunit
MLELILLLLIVFIIGSVIITEFVTNKKNETKPEKKPENRKSKKPAVPETRQKEVLKESPKEISKEAPRKEPEVVKAVEVPVETAPAKELPSCDYPEFTHIRLLEMGLSDDEAQEFVHELIPQLEEQIPLIEASINEGNFHQVERLTHGIKGSATNIGTGGVSDLLVEFNTYVKSGDDTDIAKAYYQHFISYTQALKQQYS